MRLVYSRCAGLDIHKKSVHVCVRLSQGRNKVHSENAVFGTFTADLERLQSWLRERKSSRSYFISIQLDPPIRNNSGLDR